MRVKILNHTKFWYRNHSQTQFYISFHEERRLLSISLDHDGDWLNTPPLIGLGLHLRPVEFVLVVKYRLGLPVFDQCGPCPACLQESDVLGDHALCCGSGGERISRHNALRDAIFETAVAAGLGPVKEGRFLLPGNDRRPADVLVTNWTGGKYAAMNVKFTTPIDDQCAMNLKYTSPPRCQLPFKAKHSRLDRLFSVSLVISKNMYWDTAKMWIKDIVVL